VANSDVELLAAVLFVTEAPSLLYVSLRDAVCDWVVDTSSDSELLFDSVRCSLWVSDAVGETLRTDEWEAEVVWEDDVVRVGDSEMEICNVFDAVTVGLEDKEAENDCWFV
jgi:hypothetical protein